MATSKSGTAIPTTPRVPFLLWSNQAYREAYSLAVIGNETLVEYTMPKGTTALNVIGNEATNITCRAIPYTQIPAKWRAAIHAAGTARDIEANPQKGLASLVWCAECLTMREAHAHPVEAAAL